MKSIKFLAVFALFITAISLSSCEKDEGKLPDISFKTGAGYTSSDVTAAPGDTLLIGINAAKTEDKDVLKTFNITQSLNGATGTTVYNKNLTSAEEDNFSYDYTVVAGATGTEKYTFTITNRDGLINQVSLTVTIP